ncbi:MAG: maltose ABC transporter substrate-binding protein, partial [Lachnospiraceae bacterium]|nr:maltose ABC transporter substrate-binding protein [Lachnospiraceae bacterium]
MKRKINIWFPALVWAVLLSGCQEKSPNPLPEDQKQTSDSDTVNLTVWGAEEDEELLRQVIEGVQEEYRGQADLSIT